MNDNVPQHSLVLIIDSSSWMATIGLRMINIFFCWEQSSQKKICFSRASDTSYSIFWSFTTQNECGSQLINCPKIYTTYKKDNDPLFQSKLQSISKFGSSNSLCFTNWWTSVWMSKKYHLLSEKQVISREMAKMSALIKSVKDWSGL